MWTVYILKSIEYEKYYIGYTEDIEKRLKEHNRGKTKSTKAYKPYKIVHTEQYGNKSDAYKREREIKKYKGGNEFKKLVN